MKKQLLISFGILLVLFVGTIIAIIYASGYQIDFQKGKPEISGTGLLVAKSSPDGAEVRINDHLTTATNNTINLAPGTYKVEIFKEGYFPWVKTIDIQKEVVTEADALLFPTTPTLESLTDIGVNSPVLDPTGTKIAFTVTNQSVKKNGIYIFNMTGTPILTLQSAATQIADDTIDVFSKATLEWSPDGQKLLATITNADKTTTYLLDTNSFNSAPQDITETVSTTLTQWESDRKAKEDSQIQGLSAEIRDFAKNNFSIIDWSPDETKILYVASNSATMPIVINPPLIGTDSKPQERSIQQGKVYVYDRKEDKNFLIDTGNIALDPTQTYFKSPLLWLPDSRHLLYVHDKRIDAMDYDGANRLTLYAGPFIDTYVFPWVDTSKFVMLTNLGNSNISPNLYTVSLK